MDGISGQGNETVSYSRNIDLQTDFSVIDVIAGFIESEIFNLHNDVDALSGRAVFCVGIKRVDDILRQTREFSVFDTVVDIHSGKGRKDTHADAVIPGYSFYNFFKTREMLNVPAACPLAAYLIGHFCLSALLLLITPETEPAVFFYVFR